jgi:hypothetical protein
LYVFVIVAFLDNEGELGALMGGHTNFVSNDYGKLMLFVYSFTLLYLYCLQINLLTSENLWLHVRLWVLQMCLR